MLNTMPPWEKLNLKKYFSRNRWKTLPSRVTIVRGKVSTIKISMDNYKELICSLEESVYPGRLERLTQAAHSHYKTLVEMGLDQEQLTPALVASMAGEAFREAVALTLAVIAVCDEGPERPLNPRDVIKRIK